MKKIKQLSAYFTTTEKLLWGLSVAAIIVSFAVFGGNGLLTLAASLVGVTSLILNAKGNPLGLALMVVFSIMYGIISYTFAYYGEMATYLGMTMPMSAATLVAWLKNPFEGNRSQVKVGKISGKEHIFMWVMAVVVTVIFYFILKALGTANIVPSTLSVTTSFIPVYLTLRRSPYYAAGYAANDVVLVVMWILASLENTVYISVVVCFAAFLVNDLYGLVSWKRMEKAQAAH